VKNTREYEILENALKNEYAGSIKIRAFAAHAMLKNIQQQIAHDKEYKKAFALAEILFCWYREGGYENPYQEFLKDLREINNEKAEQAKNL
jgi:hypothetical protein